MLADEPNPLQKLLRAHGWYEEPKYVIGAFTREVSYHLRRIQRADGVDVQPERQDLPDTTVQSWVGGAKPSRARVRRAVYETFIARAQPDLDPLLEDLVRAWHDLGTDRDPLPSRPWAADPESDLPLTKPEDDARPSSSDLAGYVTEACDAVLDRLREGDGRTGWSHHLYNEPEAVSAIGTAYGLRLMALSSLHWAQLDHERLRATLLDARGPDQGWASKSQRGASSDPSSSPEATAFVLRGLATFGELPTESVQALARMALDPTDEAMQSTTVAAAALGSLCLHEAGAEAAAVLADRLADAAAYGEDGVGWFDSFGGAAMRDDFPRVACTARVVLALDDYYRLTGSRRRELLALARTWLVTQVTRWGRHSLLLTPEAVRRTSARGDSVMLSLVHFTAALVLRALPAPLADWRQAQEMCVADIMGRREDRLWHWRSAPVPNREPIWMTLQALTALGAREPLVGPP